MIDYYKKKHCCLVCIHGRICEAIGKACEWCRCRACVWLDRQLNKCIFSKDYPKPISLRDLRHRILLVDEEQQAKLSDPSRRFVL